MSSDPDFVDYVCDQISGAGIVTARRMFGEYAVYCDGKVVALVCDDTFFVKPTPGGRAWIGNAEEAPPYPGGKPWLVVGDGLDDRDWVTELVRITERELPPPKPKGSKRGRGPGRGAE